MIFLLDIILGLNLLWAYKSFKNILSPPVLVGTGMFIATLVASLFYKEWEMHKICTETVFFLGGGTSFFTVSCLFFKKNIKMTDLPEASNLTYNTSKIKALLFGLLSIALYASYVKIRIYRQTFGYNIGLSDLLIQARLDAFQDDRVLHLPFYVTICEKISLVFSYIVAWLLSIEILYKTKKDTLLLILYVLFLIIESVLLLFDGAKGGFVSAIAKDVTIFGICYFWRKKTFVLPKNFVLAVVALFFFFPMLFASLNIFLGRNTANRESSDVLGEYIGAEIKNFDIYIQKYRTTDDTEIFGCTTLFFLHNRLGNLTRKDYPPIFGFNYLRGHALGNVYTQFAYFHYDFGVIGVFIATFVVAFISMFFYNKIFEAQNNLYKQNIYLYIYASMVSPLFMTFFSSKFTEVCFSISYIARFICVVIVVKLFEQMIKIKKYEQNSIYNYSDIQYGKVS